MKTLVIDIETTGLYPRDAHYQKDFERFPYIVSIAYKVNAEPVKQFIINQDGRLMSDEVIAIHGITNEMCAESEHTFLSALNNMLMDGCNADEVIGHNIYFDTSIIKANVLRLHHKERHERTELLLHKDRRVDTMMKTIKFCGLGKWPTLSELHFKLFKETFLAHDNMSDVEATYRCYLKLKELAVL